MRKSILLFFFLLSAKLALLAQLPYGNEWINPIKTYYRIETLNSTNLYHISGLLLNNTLPGFQGKYLAVYHNGQSVPIFVSTDGTFGSNDYIEFFAKENQGELETQLYANPNDQINPFYSLFSNVGAYYLVIEDQPNPQQYTEVVNNINPVNPPWTPEPYFIKHRQISYPGGMYYPGKYYSVGPTETYKSTYDVGEGYTDNQYFPASFTALTPFLYSQGPDAVFKTIYANNSANETHRVQISLNSAFQLYPTTPGQTQDATGFQINHVQVNVPVSQLNNGSNTINYSDIGNGTSAHNDVVGCLSIDYPCTFDAAGAPQYIFNLKADPGVRKHIEINNFNYANTQPVLFDITNHKFYRSLQVPGSNPIKFNLDPSGLDRELLVRVESSQGYYNVTGMTPVIFTDYTNPTNQSEYVIITNVSALQDDGVSTTNWLEEYRKYRDQDFGGQYLHPKIVDIDALYDAFGYGVRKSPLAIRNFIRYLHDHGTPKLKFVFLVGKGREAPDMRQGPTASAYGQCLVPTFGYPGSDNLLAATHESDTPLVAIGRLAANNGLQVKDYLDKVKLYEQQQNTYQCAQDIPSKVWQKEILHFSGGTSSFEQGMFRNYLELYEKRAEDSLWGAHVTSHSKTSNNPIDQSESQIIKNEINSGVSWITFFGHSATGAFDFSIDEPENYNNSPRFPIILSNGCFSGFIHDATPGYSERFVLQPDKGAVAFMATSSLSVSSGLYIFSDQLYKTTCLGPYNHPEEGKYNQPLGIAMQQALKNIFLDQTTSDYTKEIAYEMTLHGDPGLKPNQYPKPDYAIDASSVYTTPATITPGLNTFDVNVVVTNLGKCAVHDSAGIIVRDVISVTLKRTVFDANNSPVNYYFSKNIRAPFYKDTVKFTIPTSTVSFLGYGQNLFDAFVDAGFAIDEMAECNNGLTAPFTTYIQNDDILPIYPYEFAIVPDKGVTLKSSTINPFAPYQRYRLQLDTSELFLNPLLDTVISQTGGVVPCKTDSLLYGNDARNLPDSTVYYWRVQKDSTGATWHYSSFIYLKGEYPGWNQSHYFQYKKDEYLNVSLDNDRVFKFPPNTNSIHVHTGLYPEVDFETLGWDYNSANMYRYRMGNCDDGNGYWNGITFAVIDSATGQPWVSHNLNGDDWGDQFGNVHCSKHSNDQYGFDFLTDDAYPPPTGYPSWSLAIKHFVDAIPNGFYVLMYSVNQVSYTGWSPTLQQALSSLGFVPTQYVNGSQGGSFVYFVQRGSNNPFNAHENDIHTPLDVNITFQKNWFQGSYLSPKIGPAVEWHSFHWRKQLEWQLEPSDIDKVDIIGIKTDGSDTLLLTVTDPNTLFYNGGPVIDATVYPYLRLRMNTRDERLFTPGQLYYWRILFKKPPEAAINPNRHFTITNQVNQGGNLHMEIALDNVSEVDMTPVLTKYTVRDANLSVVDYFIRHDTLRAFSTINMIFDRNINGSNYNGLNRLIIEANPNGDQIEQFHFNNFAEVNFTSIGDKVNPLLDVTFDNQHIMNGDIVSAKPVINIMLKDENKFLALDTISLLEVYIKYPGSSDLVKVDAASGIPMTFYPANAANLAQDNKAQLELKPVFTVDGIYELLVKDYDKSGNNSATTDSRFQGNPATFFDYKTTFEVINKPMVSNVLNYPNPFTTSTKFVFTITGSEVPDFMKIQIMTIKGTVVKEIFKDELGPLHIGRNITEYAWDGRDQYGDLLANGIYFYDVITRLDDKQMDAMSMSYDKFFKKGFGKMAIIR